MHDLMRWLIKQRETVRDALRKSVAEGARSKDTARRRLQLVLMHDRLDLSPEMMQQMKQEIWEVVSRYMVVEDEFLEFDIRRRDELVVLVSNIQVKDLDRLAHAQ
jgi:cell division topological specificity factor